MDPMTETLKVDQEGAFRLAQARFKRRMALRPRSFATLSDLSIDEAKQIITSGLEIKKDPSIVRDHLQGRSIALLFEKPSTRTRCSFEAASRQMSGSSTYIEWRTSNFARSDIRDEVKALSRFFDFIVARVNRHDTIETLSAESEIPVINGLSDFAHPCQALTDYLTMTEYFGDLRGLVVAYVGDNNNVCRSLAHGVPLFGVSLRIWAPALFRREAETRKPGAGSIEFFDEPKQAVAGADVVYTDTWVSMGDETEEQVRLKAFTGYQVNEELMKHAPPRCLVMHCLPALPGKEISPTCLRFERSIVFDQAENRLHTQKALLAWLIKVNGR
jgi:ornithine carbamoyltransferase